MSTSEAAVAQFELGLSKTRTAAVAAVTVELGYQRLDGREPFGFRDGLRNVDPARRDAVIFVDPDCAPEEPAWTAGGTYVAYLKTGDQGLHQSQYGSQLHVLRQVLSGQLRP